MKYRLCDDTWDGDEPSAIQKVFDSKMFTMGECVARYEREFAKKFGVRHAIMTSSGSAANLLAVAGLVYSGKLERGDEVIVPAVSWSTTYFPINQMGLKLCFVDIDKDTLNIDLEKLALAITGGTKMICLVNLLGNPNDFDKVEEIFEGKNILIMEDNCESLGAKYYGKNAGTIGLVGTFSTFYSHHLSTMEGGMVVTDDEELYHYMLCIRAHGWTRNLPEDSPIYKKRVESFYESFHFIVPGFNLRPLEIEGAVGSKQLEKMDILIAQRRENARYFCQQMQQFEDIRLQKEIGESSWFGFAIVLEGRLRGQRGELVAYLTENEVEIRPIVAGNFTRNSVIKYLDYTVSGTLTASDDVHDNGFFIGNYSKNNYAEIDYFVSLLRRYVRSKG